MATATARKSKESKVSAFPSGAPKRARSAPITDQTLVWADPPAIQRGRGSQNLWLARLAPLVPRPNKWARVWQSTAPSTAYSIAKELRAGKQQLPAGRWEFRGVKDGERGAIYARYLGA